MPTDKLELKDFKVNGHAVTYDGTGAVAFRVDSQSNLIAFAGSNCREITVDGRTTTFGEKPLSLVAFAPIGESRRVPAARSPRSASKATATCEFPPKDCQPR